MFVPKYKGKPSRIRDTNKNPKTQKTQSVEKTLEWTMRLFVVDNLRLEGQTLIPEQSAPIS